MTTRRGVAGRERAHGDVAAKLAALVHRTGWVRRQNALRGEGFGAAMTLIALRATAPS